MRPADVLERPAMLPKKPDQVLAGHRTTIQPESCTRQAGEAVQVIGLLTTAAALAVVVWASAVNHFFSSVIRIQIVRHPAYAFSPFLFVGSGFAWAPGWRH